MKLRPHHGLCLLHFVGNGYSKAFTDNMTDIKERLDDTLPEIVLEMTPDAVCSCCPRRKGDCIDITKVASIDRRCLEAVGCREGVAITWGEYKTLLYDKIIKPGLLSRVCVDCEWLGLCIDVENSRRSV